jgi:hypothetical protein
MKARSVAVSIGILAGLLPCAGSRSFAQEKRQALVVGVAGEWGTDADSYVPLVGPKQEKSSSTSSKEPSNSVGFMRPLMVDEKTCVYGTGGYLAVQFGKDVVSVLCKPTTEAGCEGRNIAKLSKPVVCSRHVPVPTPEPPGLASLAMIIPWFHSQEAVERYVTPVSRGMESELKDAVVQLRDGKVDLAPAFSDLDSGSYKIHIEPLKGGSASAMTAVVAWQEGGSAIATVPGMAPGLYRISRVDGNESSPAPEAWVLVCSPGEFAAKSADYAAAVDATRKWPSEVDARAPQAVLRAYLETLSQNAGKAQ